jgi:hypothetical protein
MLHTLQYEYRQFRLTQVLAKPNQTKPNKENQSKSKPREMKNKLTQRID